MLHNYKLLREAKTHSFIHSHTIWKITWKNTWRQGILLSWNQNVFSLSAERINQFFNSKLDDWCHCAIYFVLTRKWVPLAPINIVIGYAELCPCKSVQLWNWSEKSCITGESENGVCYPLVTRWTRGLKSKTSGLEDISGAPWTLRILPP